MMRIAASVGIEVPEVRLAPMRDIEGIPAGAPSNGNWRPFLLFPQLLRTQRNRGGGGELRSGRLAEREGFEPSMSYQPILP